MNQFDLNKLDVAIKYVERMADGRNPVKNKPVEEESVLNNPNVIRCMYFIKDVLLAVKDNNGIVAGRMSRPSKAAFPFECLADFQYVSDQPISRFLAQIKLLAGNPDVKGISTKSVTDWLKMKSYLVEELDRYTGKKITRVTESGEVFGLYMEPRTSVNGNEYQIIMYSRKSQEFLAANLKSIVNGEDRVDEGEKMSKEVII